MGIHESGEMYLETIYILSTKKTDIRSVDICDEMNYSKPSVSRAVSILKKGGFINVNENGFITLTDEGLVVAKKIYERHIVFSKFLSLIGVDDETAAADACKMEHIISDTTFEAVKKHIENLKK